MGMVLNLLSHRPLLRSITLILALVWSVAGLSAAASQSGDVMSSEEFARLPRLPGGAVLGGVSIENHADRWAPFESISIQSEAPESFLEFLHSVSPELGADGMNVDHRAWKAVVTPRKGDAVTVFVETFSVRDEREEEAFFTLQARPEGGGDASGLQLRLFADDASFASDGAAVGMLPTKERVSDAANALFVPSVLAPGESSTRIFTLGDTVTVEDGDAAFRPATILIELNAEAPTIVLSAVTKLWGSAPALQLAESLAATLAGEPARGRLVTLGRTDRDQVGAGERLTYTLRMGNVGAAAAIDIATNLPVPVQLNLIAESLRVSDGDARWVSERGSIEWSVEQVPVGGVVELSYEAVVR